MRQHEMVRRDMSSVQYSRGRAAVRYKHPAEVIDLRYLPRPEQIRRHRKPMPEWLVVFSLILFCRILPVLLVLASLVLIARSIIA